jgi:hypothetical protein
VCVVCDMRVVCVCVCCACCVCCVRVVCVVCVVCVVHACVYVAHIYACFNGNILCLTAHPYACDLRFCSNLKLVSWSYILHKIIFFPVVKQSIVNHVNLVAT